MIRRNCITIFIWLSDYVVWYGFHIKLILADMNHVDNHQLDVKPLVTQAVEVAIARGVIFRDCKQDKGGGSGMNKVEHARFTLWPSRVPKTHYASLLQTQTDFNLLLDKMSQDKSFLLDSLQQ